MVAPVPPKSGEASQNELTSGRRDRIACTLRFTLPMPFAVNETHFENAAGAALGQIFRHELTEFFGTERVQVQHAVNRQSSWFAVGVVFVVWHAELLLQ
jgi:hypothetical protein